MINLSMLLSNNLFSGFRLVSGAEGLENRVVSTGVFDWEDEEDGGLDGLPDHVGIVEKVENGRVYTIEGNTTDSVRERSYPLGYFEILGYGVYSY